MMACGPILKTSLSSSKFEKCTNTSNNMSTPHIYTYWLTYINSSKSCSSCISSDPVEIGILTICNSSSAKVSHLGYDDAIDWYIPFSHIIIYRPVTLSCSHLDMFFYIFIISSSPHSVWKENTEIRDRLSTRYGHNLQTLLYLQYGF